MTNKSKILIIEDDKFLKSLCVKKLQKAGFVVFTASDGEEGLEKIKKERPALILLDVVLPGIDGFEVLKCLKQDSATASIPVILLTNLGQEDNIEKGLALGADDYLVKARFTPGQIVKKVKQFIFRKRK